MRKNYQFAASVIKGNGDLVLSASPVEFEALANGEDGKPKLRKFSMVAYTGTDFEQGWGAPVVVDLATAAFTGESVPILKDHDHSLIVGHSVSGSHEISQQRIKLSGLMSNPDAEHTKNIAQLAANGFPWQASIAGGPRGGRNDVKYVPEGESIKLNGRVFKGPIYAVFNARIREVSFVPNGADAATSASVAATHKGESTMGFAAFCKAKGFDPDTLTADQKTFLEAAYQAELKAKETPVVPVTPATSTATLPAFDVEATRKEWAAELKRVNGIRAACAKCPDLECEITENGVKSKVNLQEHAIAAGWDVNQTELNVLRLSRPTMPAIHMVRHDRSATVIEAAVCQAGKLENIEKRFDEKTLEAAHREFKEGITLRHLLMIAAREGGWQGDMFPRNHWPLIQAAFSTMSLPGILSNVANKFILPAFMAVEQTWKSIAAVRAVNDFKAITSYRMTGDMKYEKVGPGGELKHGTVGEESFSNQAETYGKMFAITRTAIINDDLGALTDAPRRLGRGAALKFNEVFWTEFLADAVTFYATANGNYAEGSGTALSLTSLTAAELLFLNQTDADDNPLGLSPATLLVANGNNTLARSLMASTEVRDTTASTKYATVNPHAGKWTVERSSYLSNANLAGYSALAWYLIANPSDLAVIEACFLNGQEMPTIEQAEADFNVLGIQMRGYHDFGVSKQDERAAVKMKGEA